MNYKEFESILTREFPGCTEETLQRFQKLDALYRDWNSRINVISRKDMDGLYSHHVLHSLAIAAYMKRNGGFPAGSSVLDQVREEDSQAYPWRYSTRNWTSLSAIP